MVSIKAHHRKISINLLKLNEMCFKEFCQLGIKILAAGMTAAAVFFGIGKLTKKKKEEPEETAAENNSEQQSSGEGNRFQFNYGDEQKEQPQQQQENAVLNGLKKTQDVCGKLFAVFQSLTMVVENLNRIFGGNSGSYEQPYFNQSNPWCYSQPVVQMDNGNVWTRLSPYIVAAGPNPNNNNGFNNYGRNHYAI